MEKKKLPPILCRVIPVLLIIVALLLGFFLGRYPFRGTAAWKYERLEYITENEINIGPSGIGKSIERYLYLGKTFGLKEAKFFSGGMFYTLHYPGLRMFELPWDTASLEKLTLFLECMYNLMDELIAEGDKTRDEMDQDPRCTLLSYVFSEVLDLWRADATEILANLETERGQEIFQALLAYQPT